jgi:phosphatidylserine decarboxylase
MNYIGHAAIEGIIIPILVMILYRRSLVAITFGALWIIAFLIFYRGVGTLEHINRKPQNELISPCEGTLVRIDRTRNEYIIFTTFLGVHNIHAQYAPISGSITRMTYKKGEFNPAYLLEKSEYNERMETTIRTSSGNTPIDVKIVQIAGQIARRIVPFRRVHDNVNRGEPIGLIKLGSRVDTWVPRWAIERIVVQEGSTVHIGDTLCELRH